MTLPTANNVIAVRIRLSWDCYVVIPYQEAQPILELLTKYPVFKDTTGTDGMPERTTIQKTNVSFDIIDGSQFFEDIAQKALLDTEE